MMKPYYQDSRDAMRDMNAGCVDSIVTDQPHGKTIDAMKTLGWSADRIFDGIQDDLSRGLIEAARRRLDFVDILLRDTPNTEARWRRRRTVQPLVGSLDGDK